MVAVPILHLFFFHFHNKMQIMRAISNCQHSANAKAHLLYLFAKEFAHMYISNLKCLSFERFQSLGVKLSRSPQVKWHTSSTGQGTASTGSSFERNC